MKSRIIYIAIALLIASQLLLLIVLIKDNNDKLEEIGKVVNNIHNYCLE